MPANTIVSAMGDAIGQELALAVAVAISPIPIIGVVVMLATPRARSNGPAFLLGWIAGLSTVGAIVLLISDGGGASDGGGPVGWVNALKLVLGILAVSLAAQQWRKRPQAGEDPEMPVWMEKANEFTPARATRFGVLLSAANPKNLLLVVGAAATIAQTGASAGAQIAALAVFVLIGTLGAGVPVALYFTLGERSKVILDDLKAWMSTHGAAIMAVLFLVIGAKLIGDAISGFSA